MNKLLIISLATILALIVSSCQSSFVFPNDTDFLVKTSNLNNSYNVGDEIFVQAQLQNLSYSNYKINYGLTNSDFGLIDIQAIMNDNQDNIVLNPILKLMNLNSKQIIKDSRKIKLTQKGEYRIIATANFYIENPKTKEKRQYRILSEITKINVG